jgi:Rrf2 family protein
VLARRYNQGPIRIREIAEEEHLPEKFLEIILLDLKNARIVESTRGARGGYQLRRPASKIFLSEVIRNIDGPLSPIGDVESLQHLIDSDKAHRTLYRVFMDVRDAAAKILENTSLEEISETGSKQRKNSHSARNIVSSPSR